MRPDETVAKKAKNPSTGAKRYDYPSKLGQADQPYVLFTRHKPVYDGLDSRKKQTAITPVSNIAMYIPLNFNVSDSIQYDNAATGLIGAVTGAAMNGTPSDLVPEGGIDLQNADAKALATKVVPALTTAATAAIGKVFSGKGIGTLVGAAAGAVGGNEIQQEVYRKTQSVVNPRQFGLFKAPNMRNFSFDFRFVPENMNESNATKDIIKEFRTAMYPELSETGLAYTFPDAFTIRFNNVGDGMVKLPEVVCTGATVTYNPNAMSYFTRNGHPVEINLSLQFQELQPIHRKMVEEGF